MQTSVRGLIRLIALFASLLLLSAGVAYLVVRFESPPDWRHDDPDGHHWLHRQLGLTADEARLLDALEAPYRSERARLQAELNARTQTLAQLLRSVDAHSAEVDAAVHHVHEVHGALQSLAIAHYFEMLEVLPKPKQALLQDLAVEALSRPD